MLIIKNMAGEAIDITVEPEDKIEEIAAVTHMTSNELCKVVKKFVDEWERRYWSEGRERHEED